MKLLFGFGVMTAFRGAKEHAMLSPKHLQFGNFPLNHPVEELAGVPYVSVICIPDDKSHKLSVYNSYVRDTSNQFRIPIIESDPNNLGSSIVRYLKKLVPGQERMYCKAASPGFKMKLALDGYPDAEYFDKKPLGENMIRNLFKEGARILGLPEDFRPHSLRSACITKLVNSPGVSLAEAMNHARHNSASASRNYQRTDAVSEGQRFRALGMMPPSSSSSPSSFPSFPSSGKAVPVIEKQCESIDADTKNGKARNDFAGNDEEIAHLKRQISQLQDVVKKNVDAGKTVVVSPPDEKKAKLKKCDDGDASSSDDNALLLVDLTAVQRKKIRMLNKQMAEKEKKILDLEAQNKELFRMFGGRFGTWFLDHKEKEEAAAAATKKKRGRKPRKK